MNSQSTYAYLAEGRLFIVNPDGDPQPIESQFVQAAEDRRAASRERNSWRGGNMWNLAPTPEFDLESLQALQANGGGDRPVQFTGMARGANAHEIYYSLLTERMGGLFLLDLAEDYERRLAHKQNMIIRDLARNPDDGRLACVLMQGDGASNLAIMQPDGGRLREITTGDSMDEAPAWVPGPKPTLVYQSAGIGRDQHGIVFGLGPCGIYRLDLEEDRMTQVQEMPEYDCLTPRFDAAGALYYIRRPYELKPRTSPTHVVKDIALAPFRLVRAFGHFLNAFSMFFSKKPLMTAGGPQKRGPRQAYAHALGPMGGCGKATPPRRRPGQRPGPEELGTHPPSPRRPRAVPGQRRRGFRADPHKAV